MGPERPLGGCEPGQRRWRRRQGFQCSRASGATIDFLLSAKRQLPSIFKVATLAIKVASATERVDRSDVPCPIDFRHFLDDDYGNWDKKWSVSQKIALIRVWAFWKAPRFRGS